MKYSLESFYVAFTAGVFLDLNLKYKTSKAMPPYVASTQFIRPVSVYELKYFLIPVNWNWASASGPAMISILQKARIPEAVSFNIRSYPSA